MTGLNIVWIACTEAYPHKFSANNTKVELLSSGLKDLGCNISIVNKYYGSHQKCNYSFEYCGFNIYTFKTLRNKVVTSFVNLFRISKLLPRIKINEENNLAIITCSSLMHNLLLIMALKFYGYKIALLFQEWYPAQKVPLVNKINGWLHSYLIGYFVDYILPISEFIIKKTEHFNKPSFKLPICAKFNDNCEVLPLSNEFVYCASAGYKDAALFVLDAFKDFCVSKKGYSLCMILSGTVKELEDIQSEINIRSLTSSVSVMSKLPYDILLAKYKTALALLIPQDPTSISEIARFSQKIAEYLSVGRPVISNSVGEINHYFTDKENMFIAHDHSIKTYSSLMKYVVENPNMATLIGRNGFTYGKQHFDYLVLSKGLNYFFRNN